MLQAGLILWQQLLPKKASAQREELLKLDLPGVSPCHAASALLLQCCAQCPAALNDATFLLLIMAPHSFVGTSEKLLS